MVYFTYIDAVALKEHMHLGSFHSFHIVNNDETSLDNVYSST